MTDNPPQNTDAVAPSRDNEATGPLAGQRLASARREHDISISEIAKELHLDEQKVQALEENLFDVLGAPVFAKGHLRKYAELVGVPIDDILADYYKLNRSTGAPPVVGPKRPRQPRDISPGPWIAGAVAVMLIGGALYWWLNRDPGVETPDTSGVLEPFASSRAPDTGDPEEPLPDSVPSAETITPETEQASPAATTELENAQLDAQQPVVAAIGDQLQIAMTYSGDCWTEVTDANGERLFFGLGEAGQTVTRNGIPPLQALFGDADNVRVTVDGVDFSLAGGTRRDKTARVTINEQ